MRVFHIRHLLPIIVAGICIYGTIAIYNARFAPQDDISWGPPDPPSIALSMIFLTVPGSLGALPLIVATTVLSENELGLWSGLIFGAAFFWYCAGWYFDCSREMSLRDKPPNFVSVYIKSLGYVSIVALPLSVFIGLEGGGPACFSGDVSSPVYANFTVYIVMFWTGLGTFFMFKHGWKKQKHPITSLFPPSVNEKS